MVDRTAKKYEVGYGKPPKKNRFRKGMSGNPKGRPKKSTDDPNLITLFEIVLRASRKKLPTSIGGRKMQMSALEILVNQLYQKALTGDEKAINLLLKLVEKANLATLEGRTGEPIRIIVEGGLPEIERISYDPADDDSKAPDGEKRCKEDDDPEETAV